MLSGNGQKIDTSKILAGLKDFQRQTVEYVFRRMYLDDDCAHKFLIADEVGLGKTLVARGITAKAIEHLRKKGNKRIDVVYVCSNLGIARQNVNRLNVTGTKDFVLSSRITLLPQEISDIKGKDISFISFTPSTSFDLKSALGIVRERALLYCILHKEWGFKGTGPRNLFRGYSNAGSFWRHVEEINGKELDTDLVSSFLERLKAVCQRNDAPGARSVKVRLLALCDRFARAHEVTDEDIQERAELMGSLRGLLAETCLEALEPDLIILDEFQRFKSLLAGKDDAGLLARKLFNFADDNSRARVLLLSATPYKMYTLTEESGSEDHYDDFVNTIRFLQDDQQSTAEFQGLLERFQKLLLANCDADIAELLGTKNEIEKRLRKIMVRTERLAATTNRDGMLKEMCPAGLGPEQLDLQGYLGTQGVATRLEQGDIMELWKSAPYLLNFMESYKLKESFEKNVVSSEKSAELRKALIQSTGTLISFDDMSKYRKLNFANARLRALTIATIGTGVWRLLWLPPSLPYYKLGGPFDHEACKTFTKRLVFSSWRVVPKAVATLLSYEAERLIAESLDRKIMNTPEARRRRRPLLKFARSKGRLTGMPLFLLLYPSVRFAQLWDTYADIMRRTPDGELPTIEDVLSHFERKLDDIVPSLNIKYDPDGPTDERWYWVVPIVADAASTILPDHAKEWCFQTDLELALGGSRKSEEDEEGSRWSDHVEALRETIEQYRNGSLKLGPPPPDLSRVLAKTCIGSPAVLALRSISGANSDRTYYSSPSARLAAAKIGGAMIRMFNIPESMALLRGMNPAEPYWLGVLEYAIDGGLQSVFDEYTHILLEADGLKGKGDETVAEGLAEAFHAGLGLRAANLRVDNIEASQNSRSVKTKPTEMRARFALRFGQGKEIPEEGAEPTREDQVRRAFNSPFWPFVLVSTSVGQEGLDFHQYCHAVVHWNLPSNPVDLEQREGRVHRYKGHAVRKNLVKKHGGKMMRGGLCNAWDSLFEKGREEQAATMGDLVPFWIYPVEGGAQIERHVLVTPLSREEERLVKLKRDLTLYRLVFGQPRQEDLVEYLQKNNSPERIRNLCEVLRMDLSPGNVGG